MSTLYSTITTDAGKTKKRTARAFHAVSASVQSWDGSIIVGLSAGPDGRISASIRVAEGSAAEGGRVLWQGDLSALFMGSDGRLVAQS